MTPEVILLDVVIFFEKHPTSCPFVFEDVVVVYVVYLQTTSLRNSTI